VAVDDDVPGETSDEVRGGQATGGRLLTARGRRTRTQVVDAAKVVFERLPYADVRVADITAEAQVSTGTFYTYFDSKEEIFYEVAAEVFAEMAEAGHLDLAGIDANPVETISDTVRRYYMTCLRNRGVARALEHAAVSDPKVARLRYETVVTGVKQFERWTRELQIRGICDTAIDSWSTSMALHVLVVRVCYDHLLASGDEREVDHLVETVTHIWARTVGLEHVPQQATAPSP
jgi:AcrR family transcriptional regulator